MKIVIDLFRLERQGDEQLVFQAIRLPGCQDTHDGVGLSIEADGFADDVAVAPEALHPEPMGHDHHVFPSDLPFLWQKIPPQEEGCSHHVVEAGRG